MEQKESEVIRFTVQKAWLGILSTGIYSEDAAKVSKTLGQKSSIAHFYSQNVALFLNINTLLIPRIDNAQLSFVDQQLQHQLDPDSLTAQVKRVVD